MNINFYQETNFKQTDLGPLPQDWHVVRLGEVVNIYDNKRIPLSEKVRKTKSGIYPYCGANGIIDYIDEYIFEGEFVLLAEDGGFFKKYENSAYIMNGKFWVNNHAHIIKGIENKSDNKFIYFWLIYEDIEQYVSGTTRQKLSQGAMKNIFLPLPPLSEQKAIAEVLQTIQEAREKTEAVIEATRQLKKSMMKHLFTYGVNRVRELRVNRVDELRVGELKLENSPNSINSMNSTNSPNSINLKETEIGLIPEHWQVVRLGEVAEKIYAGGDVPKDRFSKFPTNIFKVPIYTNGKEDASLYGFTDYPKITVPAITISARGTIGYCTVRANPFYPAIRLIVVIPKPSFDIWFIKYAIDYTDFSCHFDKSPIPQFTVPMAKNILIPLPPLPEQQAIAEILQMIDDKIEKEEAKKKALENLFKSMLNNLMSGKLRVGIVNRVESEGVYRVGS